MASTYWIKLYHEILHDPKMCRLSDHLYRRCMELFLQAGETDKDGELPSVDDMAWTFRTDSEDMLADLQSLAAVGIVHEKDGVWIVTNFAERQDPDNPAERVARHRERKHKAEYYVATKRAQEPESVTEIVTPITSTCNETLQPVQQNVTQIRTDKIRSEEIRLDGAPESPPPTKAPPRQSTRQREPIPINAAIQAFQDATQAHPNREQAIAITNAVTPGSLDRWKDVLKAWRLRDYSVRNVPGMLEWYRDGIPTNGNGKARAAPVTKAIDGAELIRLNHLGREVSSE